MKKIFRGSPVSRAPFAPEFLIVHAWHDNQISRSPMLDAVRRAAGAPTGGINSHLISLSCGGPFRGSPEMKLAVERTGLASRVEVLPRVAYEESLTALMRTGVLLLLQGWQDTVDLVSTELFECLRVGRPVLAVVPDGATAEVLRDTGGGWVVDPTDADGLRDTIVRAYRAWTSHRLDSMKADPTALERFSRERLAGDLARHFNALVEGSPPPA